MNKQIEENHIKDNTEFEIKITLTLNHIFKWQSDYHYTVKQEHIQMYAYNLLLCNLTNKSGGVWLDLLYITCANYTKIKTTENVIAVTYGKYHC